MCIWLQSPTMKRIWRGASVKRIAAIRDGNTCIVNWTDLNPPRRIPMAKMDVGRNDPCPCGSGKKYKKCCLQKAMGDAPDKSAGDPVAELRTALESQEFSTKAEAQAFVDSFLNTRNQAALDDFHGLSPEQMLAILYEPFYSPQLVRFPERIDAEIDAPLFRLFNCLVEAIGEDGLKQTATGNLPRQACRDIARAYWSEAEYAHFTRHSQINKELDFFHLHVARIVAELAGLVRKYKKRFILSRECRWLLKEDPQAIYPRLVRTFILNYNWAYGDGYPELPFIQQSFLYLLYLLEKHGDDFQPAGFYFDAYIRAFPSLLEEVEEGIYRTREKTLAHCLEIRYWEKFAAFLGLAELEYLEGEERFIKKLQVRKGSLLDSVLEFRLLGRR